MKILYLSALIVLVDQVTKLLVKGGGLPVLGIQWRGMDYGESIPVIGDFFRLTYIENPGMAFGIDIGGKLFFSIFSVAASLAIFAYLYHVRTSPLPFRTALAMILGGAVGNLIDRVFYGFFYGEAPLFYGRVVDFFDVDFFDLSFGAYHMTRWPVFNVADASVTIGVVLVLLVRHYSTGESVPLPSTRPVPAGTENGPGSPPGS